MISSPRPQTHRSTSALRLVIGLVLLLLAAAPSGAELLDITSRGFATQTSEWNGGLYPADNAIDGNAATFSHTDGGTPNNAWQLELDGEYTISRVELTMRVDCCGGRLTRAVLRWFDGGGDAVFDAVISDPGAGQVVVFDLPAGVIARRLRVGFEDGASNPGGATTYVHLGEVRVFSEVDLLPVIIGFTASPHDIAAGEVATLAWQTDGADAAEIVGIGAVGASGSVGVSPAVSQVFTLVVSNRSGRRSASLAVTVDGALLPPRISEFMASNGGTIRRSDGATPDWIEIWNPNSAGIDLAGYRLSDEAGQPARFVFPPLTLAAGGYLIIDAAAASVDGVPATGFALDRSDGGLLTLSDPGGQPVQSITYPRQRTDVSYGLAADGAETFFLNPTPGAANGGGGLRGFVDDTRFSVKRGFYSAAQIVALSSATPGAAIYFTTDGSEPSPGNPTASAYTVPLSISTTTVLRAAAFRDGFQPTDIDTQTYLFPADVAAQPAAPANFPPSWVPNLAGVVSPVPAFAHFGMDAGVIGSLPLIDRDGLAFGLGEALTAIPSLSLVLDADVLFDPVSGLHVNARSRGRAWERPASIEVLDPLTGESTQADCGLRMHGGWNRYPEMLKKAFRLYFRSEYGDSKLKFPLFPGTGIDEFDRLILRSGNGKAWPSPWRALAGGGNSLVRTTYLRDQFVRELQAATGNTHIPGSFVHLYINGHYWGLYNPVERPDEHFAAARFGGSDEDYDVIKWQRGIGHQVAAGNDLGWNALIGLVRGDTASAANYAAVGELLDLTSFVDYMVVNYFVANGDWIDNNVYAMRNRESDGRFRFFCWDSEESLLSTGGDVTDRLVPDTCTEIHQALRNNLEYRTLFADRAQRHLFNGGALTQPVTDTILSGLAATIDRAIVGESARWGDLLRPADPYDRADWLAEIDNLRNNYLGPRVTTTLAQLRGDALFPGIAAASFLPRRGGQVELGTRVSFESPGAPGAVVYYTLDGSDPRLPGGAISPTAQALDATRQEILLGLGSDWRYLDDGPDLGSSEVVVGNAAFTAANWKHPQFVDATWESGPAPLGYGTITGRAIATTIGFGPDDASKFVTSYFRNDFDLVDARSAVSLRLRLMRDDGAIVYLNGYEVARSEFPPGTAGVTANTFAVGVGGSAEGELLEFSVPPGLLAEGNNTLAVEVHQATANSSDLGFDLELAAELAVDGELIEIAGDTLVRARVLAGGVWSAIDEALFVADDRAADLYLSEVMYHPGEPLSADAEFIEIANRGRVAHRLDDLLISGGIRFDFSSAAVRSLAPGERLVLARDRAEFLASYPATALAGEYQGALDNGGDSFSLEQRGGSILWTCAYHDEDPWPGGADGGGRSLVYIAGDLHEPSSWRPSTGAGGNPGRTDSVQWIPGSSAIEYAGLSAEASVSAPGNYELRVSSVLGADDLILVPAWSSDLVTWHRDGLTLISQAATAADRLARTWQLDVLGGASRILFRTELIER